MNFIKIILAAILLHACQGKISDNGTETSSAPNTSSNAITAVTANPPPPGDPSSTAALTPAIGARNFDQINATMASLTGITGNSTINNRFISLKTQLPTDNDIKSFSFSAQGAITVLAAEYCNVLISNPGSLYTTQRTTAIGNINLAAAPTVAFAGNGAANLTQNLMNAFWGSGLNSLPNLNDAKASIVKLINDLCSGQADTATTTKNAAIGACTSVLASSPVSTF